MLSATIKYLSRKYLFFGKNLLGTDILCYTIYSSLSFFENLGYGF